MIKNRATIKAEYQEEDWGKAWRKSLEDFSDRIREIEEISSKPGSAAEKFKRLLDIKKDYSIEYIPVDVIEAILLPEVKEIEGVTIERIQDGVVLNLETLKVTYRLGYNSGIWYKDTSDYTFAYNSVEKPSVEAEYLISWYQKYMNKEVSKKEMTTGLLREMEEVSKNQGKKYNRSQTIKDINFLTRKGNPIIEDLMKRKEMYENEEKKIKMAKELNKARDERREKLLNESGLRSFLTTFEKWGVKLQSSGMIDDDFIK